MRKAMYCTSTTITDIFDFLKDWQTLIVTLPTLFFAWYTWEINTLAAAIDRSQIKLEPTGNFPKTFFATRLSHLPKCLATKVMINAITRTSGGVTWNHWHKDFIAEHSSVRKNRNHLLKAKWIK